MASRLLLPLVNNNKSLSVVHSAQAEPCRKLVVEAKHGAAPGEALSGACFSLLLTPWREMSDVCIFRSVTQMECK